MKCYRFRHIVTLINNLYFLPDHHETGSKELAHGLVTLTNFHEDLAKIKDFLSMLCYKAFLIFFGSESTARFFRNTKLGRCVH